MIKQGSRTASFSSTLTLNGTSHYGEKINQSAQRDTLFNGIPQRDQEKLE